MRKEQLFQTVFRLLAILVWQLVSAKVRRARNAPAAPGAPDGWSAPDARSNSLHQHVGGSGNGGAKTMREEEAYGSAGFVPGFIIGGIVGGLVGAAAALWFAPQSGEQTQQMVKEEADRLRQQADEAVQGIRTSAKATTDSVLEKVSGAGQAEQEPINSVSEQVQQIGR